MEMGYTWEEAQHVAQDRNRWKSIIAALCSNWNEEDEVSKYVNVCNNHLL